MEVEVRSARPQDVPGIADLIEKYAKRGVTAVYVRFRTAVTK